MSFIANGLVKFEEYEIDRARWKLSWRDEPLSLNRKTFDLLLYLLDHADHVVGKDELLRTLWPESFVEESNLTQHIFLLRKALSRHESGTKIIETVPGRGYRFAAIIEEQQSATDRMVISASESITRITLEEEVDTSEPASQGLEVTQPLLSTPPGKRRIYWIAGGSVVAVALSVAGWFGWQRWLDSSGGTPVQAVLTPMEGTTGDAILDKSLTQALRMDLAQSPYVSVLPDSTVQATFTQMMHKPGDVMTSAMAREICERTNSQSVLSGNIARVGQHFLITEEASNCVDGSVVASAKYEADKPEDLPRSIDRIAASLRQKLGESRRSIARFDTPLFPGNTASLEALKNFSQSEVLSNQGKYTDAIGLMKKAVTADPDFAEAYYDLASFYRSTLDPAAEQKAILKAYNLRDSASEPTRLGIIALYHSDTTQDLYEAELNLRNWTELYPQSVQAWNRFTLVERDLGHHAEALIAAQRALELRPTFVGLYANLAFEQRRLGDVKGSIATCEKALAGGLDSNSLRGELFTSAYVLHDVARLQQQREWAAAHPDAYSIRIEEVVIAMTEGRFSDAHRLIPETVGLLRRHGQADLANDLVRETSTDLLEGGDTAEGTRLFRSVPIDPQNQYSVEGLADVGDFASAETDLHAMQTKLPLATVLNDYRAPEVLAIIALATHRPKDAIAALERTRPLDGRNPVMHMLRGDAYLAAGEPALAEKSFRWVIDGPFLNSEVEEFPLSWLGLGRALAAEGNRAAAIDAYQHFFALWAHADPDAKYLKQAKQEFATLQAVTLAK
jgi:DNA-binding winged helix-turn-helix (wHTH) protein/tetratricopeptide (TPR) repeat protein